MPEECKVKEAKSLVCSSRITGEVPRACAVTSDNFTKEIGKTVDNISDICTSNSVC